MGKNVLCFGNTVIKAVFSPVNAFLLHLLVIISGFLNLKIPVNCSKYSLPGYVLINIVNAKKIFAFIIFNHNIPVF